METMTRGCRPSKSDAGIGDLVPNNRDNEPAVQPIGYVETLRP